MWSTRDAEQIALLASCIQDGLPVHIVYTENANPNFAHNIVSVELDKAVK